MSNQDVDNDQEVVRAPPRAKPKKKAAHRKPAPVARSTEPVSRKAPRPPVRPEGTRDINREPVRRGAVVAIGHDGEQLTRRRTAVGDKFEVPKGYEPAGWTYQWNAVTILNQNVHEVVRGDLQMYENGWRPVPASRHPGHWTAQGHEGAIIIDGLRLEERPESLTQEALAEDKLRAGAQVRDRTDALRLTQKELPGSNIARQRNQAGGMRMSIDPALDIPRPQHEIEEE